MTLASRIADLATRTAAEFKNIRTALSTKADLVGGIIRDDELPYPIKMSRRDTTLDWNVDCVRAGFYCGAPGSLHTPEGDAASSQWWLGWTMTHDPSLGNLWCTQFAQRMTGNDGYSDLWMRRVNGNNYSAWAKIMTTQDEDDARYRQISDSYNRTDVDNLLSATRRIEARSDGASTDWYQAAVASDNAGPGHPAYAFHSPGLWA
jgi:hypothetical protein